MGDSGKNINILKLDVEGEEFYSIPQMLHSKILSYVDQIHLEVHMDEVFSEWTDDRDLHKSRFLDTIQLLSNCKEYGFRLIYYGPNLSLERRASKYNRYYSYFDIVLH